MSNAIKSLALLTIGSLLASGCSSISATSAAREIRLVNEKPVDSCRYLGEAIGSQGNFFTGDFTPTENLIAGARNDLRNKAVALGGNTVHIQTNSESQADNSLGTNKVVIVGSIYDCPNQ